MTTPEIDATKLVEIEPFTQNGPLGCASACMANVARYLLNEEVTPTDVDVELSRSIESDSTVYERNTWLLNRGLRIHSYLKPESLIIEKYLDGSATFEECLQLFADRDYEGNIQKARDDYGSPEYAEFVERLKAQQPGYMRVLSEAGKSYSEDLRVATDEDVQSALVAGKVILAAECVEGSLGHQVALFPDDGDRTNTSRMYNPGEDESYIYYLDTSSPMSCGLLDQDEIYVVSR